MQAYGPAALLLGSGRAPRPDAKRLECCDSVFGQGSIALMLALFRRPVGKPSFFAVMAPQYGRAAVAFEEPRVCVVLFPPSSIETAGAESRDRAQPVELVAAPHGDCGGTRFVVEPLFETSSLGIDLSNRTATIHARQIAVPGNEFIDSGHISNPGTHTVAARNTVRSAQSRQLRPKEKQRPALIVGQHLPLSGRQFRISIQEVDELTRRVHGSFPSHTMCGIGKDMRGGARRTQGCMPARW